MQQDEKLHQLVHQAKEGLDVELKQWIDPERPEGIAKIAKATMALRNNDGGHLIVGIRDDGTPETSGVPTDVRAKYHVDVIQGIVGKYASSPFAIRVDFVDRDGQEFPVVTVPSGIQSPVAAKADLPDPAGGKPLVRDHAVYVRSISSNNTVSSSEARRGDWERLVSLCFDNREADIARFVRRHLAGVLNPSVFQTLFSSREAVALVRDSRVRATELLAEGFRRFQETSKARGMTLPNIGFREFAVTIDGDVPERLPTTGLLQQLDVIMPRHSGWSPWVVLLGSNDPVVRPYVVDGAWETFLSFPNDGLFGPTLDYWRLHPKGELYHLRGLEDDFASQRRPGGGPPPRTQLDFLIQISRVAEAISVALAITRELGCDIQRTNITLGVRWQGIQGRQLTSWVEPMRIYRSRGPSVQNDLTTAVTIPLDTSPAGIATYVESVIKELFAVFGGSEINSSVIEGIVTDTISRRM